MANDDEPRPPTAAHTGEAPPDPPLPPRRFQRVVQQVVRSAAFQYFSGPLPPPEILSQYKEAFPDCPERIVAMAERQSAHRQSQEKIELAASISLAKTGQIIGAILAGIIILGGIVLVAMDKNAQGFALIVGAAVAFGGAFIYDRVKEQEEQKDEGKEIGKLLGLPPSVGKALLDNLKEALKKESPPDERDTQNPQY